MSLVEFGKFEEKKVEKLSKAKQKWVRSFQQKKFRDLENIFVVEGEKMVLEGLNYFPNKLHTLVVIPEAEHLIPGAFITQSFLIDQNELEQISSLRTPNKLLALFQKPQTEINSDKSGIVLDGIQDPGNMGTILRLADWFGIDQVICSEDTVDVFNPKVIQASMGAIFRINVVYTNLEQFLSETSQPTYGAMLSGTNYKQVKYPKNALLIMGNEGKGVRPEVEALIQHSITIPKYGEAESLNVATATAIILAEMVS